MASFLSDAERARLSRFPPAVPHQNLVAYFTLSAADRRQIPKTTAPPNRLGFALQLGTLRYLGFCPKDIKATPHGVVVYVAEQVGVAPDHLRAYASRSQTRTDHVLLAQQHLGFRKPAVAELRDLGAWLVERALVSP